LDKVEPRSAACFVVAGLAVNDVRQRAHFGVSAVTC
jgi:hypothetical protein